jgi:hypothetical protein
LNNNSLITATIHQPHFLPWLGYYNKLANSDLFIAQDNVQFRKRFFQNRTYIQSPQKQPLLITIPVISERTTLIKDVKIINNKWENNFLKTLQHSYGRSKYFKEIYEYLEFSILKNNFIYLIDFNLNLLELTSKLLSLNYQIKKSHNFKKQGNPTDDLVFLCLQNDVKRYIFGEGGGIKYHGTSTFKKNNIETLQQNFKNKIIELNKKCPEFTQMSIIHYLFTQGISETEKIIKNIWNIRVNQY